MNPRYPSLVVPLPEPPDVIRLSVRTIAALREHAGKDVAHEYALEAMRAKSWEPLLAVVRRWVTTEP